MEGKTPRDPGEPPDPGLLEDDEDAALTRKLSRADVRRLIMEGPGARLKPAAGAVDPTALLRARKVSSPSMVAIRTTSSFPPAGNEATVARPAPSLDVWGNAEVVPSTIPERGFDDATLALSKELAKAMGGEISVESEVGNGTTFVVRLPITNKAAVSDGVTSSPEIAAALIFPKETSASRKAVRQDAAIPEVNDKAVVLLIEDNPDVVEYLIICLDDHYQLDYAYNGRAGIEKALETVPDLIISDVMMPEKDGFEVCETLKYDERTSHIPIILLTARADAASRIAGLRRGADAYLSKPFHREELLAQLQVLTEKQQRITAWLSRKIQNEKALQIPETVAKEDLRIEDAFIQKLRKIVAENYADEGFGLPQLCQKIGMSRSQLFRKMTALIATSPSDFIRSYRLNEAKKLLETTDLNVSEVAWQCGFVRHLDTNTHRQCRSGGWSRHGAVSSSKRGKNVHSMAADRPDACANPSRERQSLRLGQSQLFWSVVSR